MILAIFFFFLLTRSRSIEKCAVLVVFDTARSVINHIVSLSNGTEATRKYARSHGLFGRQKNEDCLAGKRYLVCQPPRRARRSSDIYGLYYFSFFSLPSILSRVRSSNQYVDDRRPASKDSAAIYGSANARASACRETVALCVHAILKNP